MQRDAAALEDAVARARQGDAAALDRVARAVRDDVYNLALRMLWCPHDAADATQEILLKVVTRLASFEGRSAFRTWVYSVAYHHLLNQQPGRMERERLSFDSFGASLAEGLADDSDANDPQHALLVQEVRIGCTHAMLQCLDREHRAAYVLGEILELPSRDAAAVMGIGDAACRKRTQRARERIVAFMAGHCGLVDEANACRCARRTQAAQRSGHVRRDALLFADVAPWRADVNAHVLELSALQRALAMYRAHPRPEGPQAALTALRDLFDSGALRSLH
jgi:RNA polymerase sigma factor (sigma-70 family)